MTNKLTHANAFKLVAAKKINAPIKMGPELPRRNYSRGRGARVLHPITKKKAAAPAYWVRVLYKHYSKWHAHLHYCKPTSKAVREAAFTTKQFLRHSRRAFFAFSSFHTARLYRRHICQLTRTALRQRSKSALIEIAQHNIFSAPVNSRRTLFIHLTGAEHPFRSSFWCRKRKIFKRRFPILFSRKSFTYGKYRSPNTSPAPRSVYLALRAAFRGAMRTRRRKHYLQNQRLWKNFCVGPKRQVWQLARSIDDILELKKGPTKLRRHSLLPRKRFVVKRARGKHLARFSSLQTGLLYCSRRQGRVRRKQLLQQRLQFYRGQCRSTLEGSSTLPFYVVRGGVCLPRVFGVMSRYRLLRGRARHAITVAIDTSSRRSVPTPCVGVFRRVHTRNASVNQRIPRARYARRALLGCMRRATTSFSLSWKRARRGLHRDSRYRWALALRRGVQLAFCTQKKEHSKVKTFCKPLRFFRPIIKYRREIKWQLKWAARRQNKIYRAFCRVNHRAWYGRRACRRLLLSPATTLRRKVRRKAERRRHQKAHWWPEVHKKKVLRAMQRAERQKARDKDPIEALPETLLFVADRLARGFKGAYIGHKRRCRWKFNRLFLNVRPRTQFSVISTRGCYQRRYFRLATNIRRPRRFLRRRFAYAAPTNSSGAQKLFRSRFAILNRVPPLFVATSRHSRKHRSPSTAVVKSTVLATLPYFSGAPALSLSATPNVDTKDTAVRPTGRSDTSKKKSNLPVSTISIKSFASEITPQPSF